MKISKTGVKTKIEKVTAIGKEGKKEKEKSNLREKDQEEKKPGKMVRSTPTKNKRTTDSTSSLLEMERKETTTNRVETKRGQEIKPRTTGSERLTRRKTTITTNHQSMEEIGMMTSTSAKTELRRVIIDLLTIMSRKEQVGIRRIEEEQEAEVGGLKGLTTTVSLKEKTFQRTKKGNLAV